ANLFQCRGDRSRYALNRRSESGSLMDIDPTSSRNAAGPVHEELFELLVESATDFAIYTTDLTGQITSWNVGATRLFGYSEQEMLDSDGDIVFTPEDRASGVPAGERLRGRTKGRAEDERWHQRKDGSRFWASGLLMPLRDGTGYVKIARDRTEQQEADQQIREREERFRILATSIPQLVFLGQVDGNRTWPGPQWIEFTGLGFDDSLGHGWLTSIHPDDRDATQAGWQEASRTGEYYVEHRVRREADGEYRWHQTRARPMDGEVKAEWVGTMTDVHDLRTLKDRQQVLLEELQHRTRNLLGVIQAMASRMMDKGPSMIDFRVDFEERLRALSRVQSLLAKVDYGRFPLRMLIEAELAAHGDGDLESGKIEMVGPDISLHPMAAQTLALAVHELATNALKYGALAQAAGKLSVTWTIEQEERQYFLVLEWRETNVHMPDESAPRRKGYGTELIERALSYQLKAASRLEFGRDGVSCVIRVPVLDADALKALAK
ncbi:MAG: sensor histidine kinase, partial [Sphingobium sp.]